jgi:hypothetical protein
MRFEKSLKPLKHVDKPDKRSLNAPLSRWRSVYPRVPGAGERSGKPFLDMVLMSRDMPCIRSINISSIIHPEQRSGDIHDVGGAI